MWWFAVKVFYKRIWNWAKKIPYQIWILVGVLLILVGLCWFSYSAGARSVQSAWNAEKVEIAKQLKAQRLKIAELKTQSEKVTTKYETVTVHDVKVIHEKGKAIIKEVPVYLYGLPAIDGKFRVFHDAAALGLQIPGTAGFNNAAAVPIETLTTTLTENYTQCREDAVRLMNLQAWVREQQQLYLDSNK